MTERGTHNRVRKSVYGATKPEALEAMRRLLEDPVVVGPPSDARCTVRTWVTYWPRTTLDQQVASEADRAFARTIIQGFLTHSPLALMALKDVQPSDVERLRHDIWHEASGLAEVGGTASRGHAAIASATVRTAVSLLRGALDGAVLEGLLRDNPARADVRPGVRWS